MNIRAWFQKAAAKLAALKGRIGILGIGLVGNQLFSLAFNWGLYPPVIYHFGLIWGYVIMVFLSAIVCYLTILFYDWSKKDWLGIETLKELKEYNGKNRTALAISNLMQKSELFAFLFLSIKFDPFITVVYMRHGAHQYNGMTKKDWKIFWTSLILGDIYWTAVIFFWLTVAQNLKIIWEFVISATQYAMYVH